MTARQQFSQVYLLPDRTATVISEWALASAKEQLGDAAYDPANQEELCRLALLRLEAHEQIATELKSRLGGNWAADDVRRVFSKVGLQPA
jgi:hypothetical protein